MHLRPLEKDDIPAAARIVGMNYNAKYESLSHKELAAMFSNMAIKPKYVVADDEGDIVGFGGYTQSWMDYGVYEMFWVNVDPDYQKAGLGKRIVNWLIADIVRESDNEALIQLTADASVGLPEYYSKNFGFETIQEFGHYHLMTRILSKSGSQNFAQKVLSDLHQLSQWEKENPNYYPSPLSPNSPEGRVEEEYSRRPNLSELEGDEYRDDLEGKE